MSKKIPGLIEQSPRGMPTWSNQRVDDHSAVVQVEEPRENFRLRHRHVENEPAADFLFDVPEQEYYPAQFSMPVVMANEAAFDIEFLIVPAG